MGRENLELGPTEVNFGIAGAEADLGRTEGGVRVAFSTDVADLLSDQWGTQPEDQAITGQGARITCPLAEYTMTNLAIALNQNLVGGELIEGARKVGTKMRDNAKSLLLKKYVNGVVSENPDNWMRFPVAAPVGSPEIMFGKADQRIVEVEFVAFPDANDILYYIGDEAAS